MSSASPSPHKEKDTSDSEDNTVEHARYPRAQLSGAGIQLRDQAAISEVPSSCIPFCTTSSTTSTGSSPLISFIPYKEILNVVPLEAKDASRRKQTVAIFFITSRTHKILKPGQLTLTIDVPPEGDLLETILNRSYQGIQPHRRIMVLVNPHGGKGKALDLFMEHAHPILEAAGCQVEIVKTEKNKHATEIVKGMDLDKFDVIACASGDGIPYEVFNGLYEREDRVLALNNIAVTQLPCGSGNAMSNSCHGTNEPSHAAFSLVKSKVTNIDLMAVTQGDKTTVSFLSQTCGVIADADIGTEHLRFLGPVRFDLGVVHRVLTGKKYPCDISIKYLHKEKGDLRIHYDKSATAVAQKNDTEITEESLTLKYSLTDPIPDDWEKVDPEFAKSLSVFYTGKMPVISPSVQFFPASLPNDGAIDLIMTNASTPITKQLPIFLSVDSGEHVHLPEVQHSKILAYRLTPRQGTKGYLSIDGEEYPFTEFQVEVLPNAAKTLTKTGTFVETSFSK